MCVCVYDLQHSSEVYMYYITIELQTIEKIQPIINSLVANDC